MYDTSGRMGYTNVIQHQNVCYYLKVLTPGQISLCLSALESMSTVLTLTGREKLQTAMQPG